MPRRFSAVGATDHPLTHPGQATAPVTLPTDRLGDALGIRQVGYQPRPAHPRGQRQQARLTGPTQSEPRLAGLTVVGVHAPFE